MDLSSFESMTSARLSPKPMDEMSLFIVDDP